MQLTLNDIQLGFDIDVRAAGCGGRGGKCVYMWHIKSQSIVSIDVLYYLGMTQSLPELMQVVPVV